MYIVYEGKKHNSQSISWTQFNKVTKEVRNKKNDSFMEFLGEGMDSKGTIHCIFREISLNRGKKSEGEMYFVNNDVVFEFQKKKKPVKRESFKGVSDEDLNDS